MSPARFWGLLHFIGLLAVLRIRVEAAVEEILDPSNSYQPCQHYDPLMNPTHERFRDVDVVWQIPQNPQAIVVLLPASGHTPLTFFDFGPNCKLCYGLPEERIITLDALKRGYAVIALKAFNAKGSDADWNARTLKHTSDIDNSTMSVVRWWTNEHHLETLSLVLWGQSAGGVNAIKYASTLEMPVGAVVAMGALKQESVVVNSTFPPIKIVSMAGNRYSDSIPPNAQVEEMVNELIQFGVSASWIKVSAKPLSPFYLAEHIHCMSRNMSKKIYYEFLAEDLLDGERFLTANPQSDGVEDTLWRSHALPFCTARNEVCLLADVVQELQRAFGVHSITSEANNEIFSWLDDTLELKAEGAASLELSTENSAVA